MVGVFPLSNGVPTEECEWEGLTQLVLVQKSVSRCIPSWKVWFL